MSSIILPFSVQLPAGYSLLTAGTGTQGATTTGTSATAGTTPTTATNAAPADVVNIGNTWATGDFTAKSGDHYRMSELFKGSTSDGQTIAGYRVALGAGSGKLFLGSEDVTDRTSFTADDFRQLTYVAGAGGSQSLTVVAQAGKLLSDGNMTQEIDSQAVQITATIAGTRSINAMNALSTRLSEDDPDAGTVGLAQQAAIFTGWSGAARPTLQTDGNFDTKSGDSYRMSALFAGSAPTGQTIAGYRVALGDPGDSGGGLLLLAGKPTDKTEFTADEFRQLTYVAGTSGSQGLTVVAQIGGKPLADGMTLTGEIDSQAVQITANVTGTRSINAMNALGTRLSEDDPDADTVSLAQQAAIFTGWSGAARPTLQTDGNFDTKAGDSYRMSALFKGSAPAGQTIAGYLVALGDPGDGGCGHLLLAGKPTDRTEFTADEFRQLTYIAGDSGSQSLTVVAQIGGKPMADGMTLTGEIDSQAVQITANVAGTRSINAMNALSAQISEDDPDADIVSIAQQAGIFTGWSGAARPTLQTVGNFTAAGNVYQVGDLFTASVPTGQTIAGYQVTVGDGGGKLQLSGQDVAGQTSFTPDQFAHLTYTAGLGTDGSQLRQSLTVAAQTEPIAEAIDFNAAGDTYSMSGLFTASVPTGQWIAEYDVTLRDGGGKLQLNGQDVLGQTNFTPDEFAHLTYVAGPGAEGSLLPQSLTVVAQTTRDPIQEICFDAEAAGETYAMNGLFAASTPVGQTITRYQVTLGDGGGKLQLNGQDVPGQTDFSPDEFAHLAYVAGPGTEGSQLQQSLTVAAQTTTDPVTEAIGFDADAVGETYAMNSLFTASAPSSQAIVGYQVNLGDGGGKLQLNGQDVPGQDNFRPDEFGQLSYIAGGDEAQLHQSLTVVAQTMPLPTAPITQDIGVNAPGDIFSMSDLFTASAPTGQAMAGYQVTLGDGGGKLQLNGQDVPGQTSFTPDEFAHLTYVAGPGAEGLLLPQSLTVVGQPATSQTIDFTPVADTYRMDDLFHASAPTGQTIVGYRVALGAGGGKLYLGTKDVTGQTSFTADEFRQLAYVARADADASQLGQSLVVVAQTGKLQTDGTISQEIDSPAVQITANVTGTRSLNAMNALSTQLSESDPDASSVSLVQQANIFNGWSGASRPTLQTDGNFDAEAGDSYRMSELFKGSASAGRTIAGYRVALADPGDSHSGYLLLAGKPTDRTEFTADEFRQLTYVAGADGSQGLTVVAQIGGKPMADGMTLTEEIDSQAVQITANVTGTRSINAMNGLSTQLSANDPDANIVSIAQQAGIFNGWSGAARPVLNTALSAQPPMPLDGLQSVNGAYQSAGSSATDIDLSAFYAAAVGSNVSPGVFTSPDQPAAIALLLLGGEALGAFQQTGDLISQAIAAYNTAKGW